MYATAINEQLTEDGDNPAIGLCIIISTMLCACGKKGNPIILPDREDIISIGVSDGEKYAMSPNTEEEADAFISEFLSILMDMEVTNKESITDVPANKDYITISLNCDDKVTTPSNWIAFCDSQTNLR